MTKIPLTIDPSYVSNWGFFEAIREFAQNWRDGDEYDGYAGTIEHFPRTNRLVFTNKGATLDARMLLLLGASSKRGSDQRGQFGEGFCLACLAATRAGHPVTVYNGDEVWRPVIEKPGEGHTFEHSELLVINTRKLQTPRTDFSVEIENITKEVWDITKKLFLFLSPPLVNDTVAVGHEGGDGRVLLAPEYSGKIFSRGIFVNVVDNVEYGYDVTHLKLDRDRQVIEEWDLRWRLSQMLAYAHKQEPEKFRKKIYSMAKEGKADVKSIAYHADAGLLKALREEFQAEHGEKAIPVVDTSDSRELEALGATPVVVNSTLRELLEKTGLRASEMKEKLKAGIKARYAWSDLAQQEKDVCTFVVEPVAKSYTIVDFNDPSVLCQVLSEDDGKTLGISKQALLLGRRELVLLVVVQEAARRGIPEREVCADAWFR